MVLREMSMPCRSNIFSCRCKGWWSAHLATITCANKLAPAVLFSIGCGGGGPHRAVAGVLQTNVLNYLHRGRDVFVTFAGLFGNQPQVLAAAGTVLFRLGQVVNDSLPLQVPRQ